MTLEEIKKKYTYISDHGSGRYALSLNISKECGFGIDSMGPYAFVEKMQDMLAKALQTIIEEAEERGYVKGYKEGQFNSDWKRG